MFNVITSDDFADGSTTFVLLRRIRASGPTERGSSDFGSVQSFLLHKNNLITACHVNPKRRHWKQWKRGTRKLGKKNVALCWMAERTTKVTKSI